jgi:hypothetical protein
MEFTTSYCPNLQCTHYGKRGFGTHLVHRGADRGIPRLLCTRCDGTFSARQGTACFESMEMLGAMPQQVSPPPQGPCPDTSA